MRRKWWAQWGVFLLRYAQAERERSSTSKWARAVCIRARSDDGEPIQKQEEVYVIRYEKGVAYVRRWDDQGANDAFAVSNDSLAQGHNRRAQQSQKIEH